MGGWFRCGRPAADPCWPTAWSISPRDCGPPRACSSTRWTPSRGNPSGRTPRAIASRRATGTTASEQTAGLTPQGYLAVVGDRLIVPCGQQLPAFLDRKTGKLATYTTGWGGRIGLPKGCWFVAGVGNYLSHAGDLYDISRPNDERLANPKPGTPELQAHAVRRADGPGWTSNGPINGNSIPFEQPVLTPDVMYEADGGIVARDLKEYTLQERTKDNMPAHRVKDELPDNIGGVFRQLWKLPSKLDVHIKAGKHLYVGGPGVVEAIDTTAGQEPKVVWRAEFEGTPRRMLAADEKLFIVTAEGSILAFAAGAVGDAIRARGDRSLAACRPTNGPSEPRRSSKPRAFATVTPWCWGSTSGRLVEELVRQSSLHVIAVDADAGKVAALRQRLYSRGPVRHAGERSGRQSGDLSVPAVSGQPRRFREARCAGSGRWRRPRSIRCVPTAAWLCVWGQVADRSRIEQICQGEKFTGASVRQAGDCLLLARSGPLPGAADWSHAEANAASTGASEDEFIRAPMSVLWFDAAQRWHKYPGQNQVRVAGGRLVLFEKGLLRASDVYTGRKLWEVELSDAPPDRQGNPLRAAPTVGTQGKPVADDASWWSSRTRST